MEIHVADLRSDGARERGDIKLGGGGGRGHWNPFREVGGLEARQPCVNPDYIYQH